MERRLAAILIADVVGYGRLRDSIEVGTLVAVKSHHEELMEPAIKEHHGRIMRLLGDTALVEFTSVVDAVSCACKIQRGMAKRNADVPASNRIEWRIGINLSDIFVDGNDTYGDGVGFAARVANMADTGGICVSGTAFDEVKDKLDMGFEFLGEHKFKNISKSLRAYRVLI